MQNHRREGGPVFLFFWGVGVRFEYRAKRLWRGRSDRHPGAGGGTPLDPAAGIQASRWLGEIFDSDSI